MPEDDQGPKDGSATPPRPAEDLPLHPRDHQAGKKERSEPAGVNIIPLTQLQEGDVPVVAVCPYCGEDISLACMGCYVATPQGPQWQAFFPLRCPECKHPFLWQHMSSIVQVKGPS